MKKTSLFAAAAAMALVIAMGGYAVAGGTTTVGVSATVVGTCQFNSGGTITFSLDPAVGGNVSGTVTQPVFWCTKGAAWTISNDGGLHNSGSSPRLLGPGPTDLIPYSFTYTTTGSGNGKTSAITMNISSAIAQADYINATAGAYSDTVTLTIAP